MSSIHLILGSHNSQPLDLLDNDRAALYEHSYKPFLKLLYNHEDIKFTLYYSGLLIEWLEKHHSEFVDVLTEMVKRRQVELLGGAFFEPLLPLIPRTDRIGQIERLTTHIRKCFGRRPRGAWIPESIWDQRIAGNLNAGGIEYAFLRDSAFRVDCTEGVWARPTAMNGAKRGSERRAARASQYRPVLTEDQGKTLALFPLAWDLTSRMFVDTPETIIAEIKDMAAESASTIDVPGGERRGDRSPVVSLIFDGSRLGYDAEHTRAGIEWYDRFLDLVTQNRDWISVGIPNRIVRIAHSRERRYAPASSLGGLMDWLTTVVPIPETTSRDTWLSFRSIMEEYPESSRLYARMQHTHVLVNQVRGDKYRKMTAREELWRGQSHYAYWHNRTGGIYRSSLRKATYAALIEAEKTTRERGIFIPAVSRLDVDLDGEEEILYQGNEINAYIDRAGARLFELDHVPRNWNYLDTLERRPEPFHDTATVEYGYDRWPRSAFVDHLLRPGHAMAPFARGEADELYELAMLDYEIDNLDKEHNSVSFAGLCRDAGSFGELEIRKIFRFVKSRIEVTYELVNTGMERLHADFATEINLSFHSLEVGKLRLHLRQGRTRRELPPDPVEMDAISDLQFLDLHNGTVVTVNPADRPDLWCYPVEAVGILLDRPHWFYQSNCAVLRWPVDLGPGDSRAFSVSLRIDNAK
ncbi:MAG: DUF1926 domain-containing protein [Spirochaetales bacterium]|nr:DUF1926 domain-containing protein [Spirochaetales bacterium]